MNSVSLVDGHIDGMTEEQIVKAMERCGNIVDSSCKECAFHKTYNASCVVKLMKNTLDLINRQKVENDELQRKIVSCNSEIESLKQTAEELDKANLQLMAILQTAQSEAIKEFAERLKEDSLYDYEVKDYFIFHSKIDYLLKEMDGEQNDR